MYVKFDPGQKFTKARGESQEISDTADAFEDAGYVLCDNEVVVDIDSLSHEQIRAMIDEFKIKTQIVWTDRGAHLYFKKPVSFKRAKGVVPLGFEAEFKHKANTKAVTIKRNGVMRDIDNPGIRKPLPNYLIPLNNMKSLVGLDEGDERNNALYVHKKRIARLGNTAKILRFINRHIFETPLDDEEFESVARDEPLTAEKDGENVIADAIMRDRKVVLHKGSLFFLDDGYYSNDLDQLNRIVYEYCAGQKTRYVDEVIKQMRYRADIIADQYEFKVKLRNGYLYRGKFFPYGYYDFTPYFIDIDYDPDAPDVDEVNEYLDLLSNGDADYRDFILEVIATCLVTNNDFKRHLAKFFIFVGDGGNGKGTLLQIITKILGEKNVAANSINELSDERYVSTLVGKLANLGDDIQDEPINRKEMKTLKNLSTGDIIQVRRLYENPVSVSLHPTLIFTSNHILKSFDKDLSYKRRVMWCPMYSKPEKPNPSFISKITSQEALRHWMRIIVEAYERLYERKGYTECEVIERFNDEYHRNNDSTIEFVEQLSDEEIDWRRPPAVYEDYEAWCKSNGEALLSSRQLKITILNRGFRVQSCRRKGLNSGRSFKCYRKNKDENQKGNLTLVKQ